MKMVFEKRGKPEYPKKNLSVQRREPTNSTHNEGESGVEPEPHWWEASALTTAPSLHPSVEPPTYVTQASQSLTFINSLRLACVTKAGGSTDSEGTASSLS